MGILPACMRVLVTEPRSLKGSASPAASCFSDCIVSHESTSKSVWAFFLHVYMYHTHAWCPGTSEKGVRCPGTGVVHGCELPHGCCELDTGSPPCKSSQQTLLTTDPSLQPKVMSF